ncbi:MAG: YncE family protein, partial [Thermoplasmataceae archaeon]
VYVTNELSNNITVINGTTNTVIKNIGVGSYPYGAAFDSINGNVYVTNVGPYNVSIINGTTNTVIKNIGVGLSPTGVVFDSTNGYVYVTNYYSNNISIINGATNTVIKNISVGSNPYGAAFDSTNGYVYVSIGSGAVSVLGYVTSSTKYSITFTESGLPSDTMWYVNLSNGQTFSGSKNTISFSELNGTYSYSIATVNKSWSSTGGSFTVKAGPISQSVTFSEVTYKVTFTESGLPSGTMWYVNLSNGQTFSGSKNTISFSESNGTYSYSISAANKQYKASPSNGTFSVAGSSKSISTTFSSTNASSSSTLYDIIGAVIAVIIIASVSIILIKRKRV